MGQIIFGWLMTIFFWLGLFVTGYVLWIALRTEKKSGIIASASDIASAEPQPVTIWNPDVVALWSLLFTPVWGAVLVSINWHKLQEKRKAQIAVAWAVAFFLFLPVTIASQGFLYFGLFFPAWYFYSCLPQNKYVLEMFGESYSRRHWVKPVILGWIVAYPLISWGSGVIYQGFP